MTEYYYNLETGQVEEGRISEGLNRMGPFASHEEAAHALTHARARNAEWEAEDRRWNEAWEGDEEVPPASPHR